MASARYTVATLLVATLLVCAPPLIAGEDGAIEGLAKQIARLRGEVAGEARQIARQRRETDAELSSLKAELEELRLQADRAESRARSLQTAVRERRSELNARTSQRDDIRTPLLKACDAIEASIAKTAPLHREARQKRVSELRDGVESGAVSPSDGLEQLAAVVRDELELARTTQLTKEVIAIGGEERLLPVVALGTALIFWQLDDGRAGLVARRDGRWSSIPIASEQHRAAVEALYQAEKTSAQSTVLPLIVPLPSSRDSNSKGRPE